MNVTFLPHALEQMEEREISASRVHTTMQNPDHEYPGDWGRTVAEKRFGMERSAIKVVYNRGPRDERIIVSVMRGRPRR
ncbi:MAG: DUF4258 domain-containing protein [Rubrobacteraceae bacterium]|nr:DUF4258 domain-containing protein [Rubrobacteraceae bacterium]